MEILMVIAIALLIVIVVLAVLILHKVGRPTAVPEELSNRIAVLEKVASDLPSAFREEARIGRDDLRSAFTAQTETLNGRFSGLDTRLTGFGSSQAEQLGAMRQEAGEGRKNLEEAVERNAEGFSTAQAERLKETNEAVMNLSDRLLVGQNEARLEQMSSLEAVTAKIGTLIATNEEKQDKLRETLGTSLDTLRTAQAVSLEAVTGKISSLIETNDAKQDKLRETVSDGLEKLRTDNAEKLEKMRETVDEKLQGTLEKRLGESFQLVSERLEQVHKGLGEMQNLATGVGDLKRVLSNVKSRGGWGEVQLGMLLEDMLTRDQYATNVKIRPDFGEVVEFAVKLPGQGEIPLWLPIDAKFPHEDYDRLLIAQDAGVVDDVEKAAVALERAVRLQAKTICEKHIHPPHSTDFAIMYLPTEGLFAEVIRRPGLANDLQIKHRVLVQGPTTLAALLSSLQMGFRTLAIEKRSSEVWQVLGAAKAEFLKYGQAWERLGKQLDTAKKTVDDVGVRTRAITRTLRDVEMLEAPAVTPLVGLLPAEGGQDEEVKQSDDAQADA